MSLLVFKDIFYFWLTFFERVLMADRLLEEKRNEEQKALKVALCIDHIQINIEPIASFHP